MNIIRDSSLGGSIGSSLGSGIAALTEAKLNQLTARHNQSKNAKLYEGLGFDAEDAKIVSQLPEELQQGIVAGYIERGGLNQVRRPSSQEVQNKEIQGKARPIQQMQDGLSKQYQVSQAPSNDIQSLLKPFGNLNRQPVSSNEAVNNFLLRSLSSGPSSQQDQQGQQAQLPKAPAPQVERKFVPVPVKQKQKGAAVQPEQIAPQASLQQAQQQDLGEVKKESLGEVLSKPTLKEAKKQEIADRKEADKETKKYYDHVLALNEAADFSEMRLNKMKKLVEKGGLPVSSFYSLFKNLEEHTNPTHAAAAGAGVGAYAGGPLGSLVGATIGGLIQPVATILRSIQKFTSPNTEQFEKLSNDFIKDAKSIFGSRITDADLKAFMSTVPTLAQTDAGKLAIINNMEAFNKAAHIRAKAMKAILKENGGHRPADLQILVEERAKPELDKVSQDFIA